MSGFKIVTEEVGWTKANLQRLLAAMKSSIPKHDRLRVYTIGLKSVDWDKVAFPPFSPKACQQKGREILQNMRKIRTLTELIVEAEDGLSSPVHKIKAHLVLPKRPSRPNAMFYEENCANFHQQRPELSRKELFRFLINMYTELPDEEKAQYEEKYQMAVEEYKRRMLEFRKKEYEKPPIRELRTKPNRDSADTPDQGEQHAGDAKGLPPKPPVNGYNLFCKEQLGSMAGVSKRSYVKVWAQRWRGLTEGQREEHNARCRELKRQYPVKLSEYLMTLDEEEQQEILNKYDIKRPKQRTQIKRKVKAKKLPGEPKMPSQSGNVIFCKDQMKFLKEKIPNAKERFGMVNQMWHELSNKEKKGYKERVHEKIRKYSLELQEWFKTLTAAEQKDYLTRNPTKCNYLDATIQGYEREDLGLYRPSDSEDDDIEDSSSDEEEDSLDYDEEEEEEEEDDDFMFEMC